MNNNLFAEFKKLSLGSLTTRDAFAIQAMQALTSNENFNDPYYIAKQSYRMADAMLVRRDRGDTEYEH